MNVKSPLTVTALALCGVLGTVVFFINRSPLTSNSQSGSKPISHIPYPPGMLPLPSAEASWLLILTTGGGFSGNGSGGIVVNSQGSAAAGKQPDKLGEFQFSCKSQLSAEEMRSIEQMVLSAKPSSWKEKYINPKNPDGCCDQVGYDLELHYRKAGGTEKIYAASWYDDSGAYLLPADLTALYKTIEAIQYKTLRECHILPELY